MSETNPMGKVVEALDVSFSKAKAMQMLCAGIGNPSNAEMWQEHAEQINNALLIAQRLEEVLLIGEVLLTATAPLVERITLYDEKHSGDSDECTVNVPLGHLRSLRKALQLLQSLDGKGKG